MPSLEELETTRTVEEVVALRDSIKARNTELDAEFAGKTFDAAARAEFTLLGELETKAVARENEFRARRARVEEIANKPGAITEAPTEFAMRARPSRLPENLLDLYAYRGRAASHEDELGLIRDGAKKLVETANFAHPNADHARNVTHLHKLLDSIDAEQGSEGILARRIIATANPAYQRAFAKYLAGRPFTSEEQRAIDVVGASALTTGGYAVPYTLDASLILTGDGSVNPLRDGMARIERVTGNTWKGLTSAGITITRGPAEDDPVTPTSITFGQPEVTVQPVKVEIQYSIEADEDWPRLQAEMARVFAEAKDDEEAESFVNGVGTTVYPEGVVAGLAATSHVGTTGNGFDIGDIDELESRLGAKYRARAQYLANRAIYSAIGRFAEASTGSGGAYRPNRAADLPATLNGYRAREVSTMSSDYTTTGEEILLFGDFSNFLIVDKVGMTIEIDPHVRNGDGKWIGKRALLMHYRNSSVILNDAAFRLLKIGVVTTGI